MHAWPICYLAVTELQDKDKLKEESKYLDETEFAWKIWQT